MKLIKLTNKNAETKNNTKWVVGKSNRLPKIKDPQLCEAGVLHAYKSVNLGLLLNPIHANIPDDELRIFEVEGEIIVKDWGKVGCFSLTVKKELKIPLWYKNVETRLQVIVKFAKLCAEAAEAADCAASASRAADWAAEAADCAASASRAADWAASASRAAARAADWAADWALMAAGAAGTKIDFEKLAERAVKEAMGEKTDIV